MLYTYFTIPKLLQVGGKRLARFIVAKVTRGGAEVIIRFIHRTPESTSDFNTRKWIWWCFEVEWGCGMNLVHYTTIEGLSIIIRRRFRGIFSRHHNWLIYITRSLYFTGCFILPKDVSVTTTLLQARGMFVSYRCHSLLVSEEHGSLLGLEWTNNFFLELYKVKLLRDKTSCIHKNRR